MKMLFAMGEEPPVDGDAIQTMESHLHQMISRCDASGARPVLLTYPMPGPHHEDLVEKLSRETGVTRIEIRPRFETAARTMARNELFVTDGHCADGGYEIMGQAAAEIASEHLDSRRSGR